MTPNKKQIAEVTEVAKLNNVSLERALSTLKNCSLSTYKSIGANGVVECAAKVVEMIASEAKGGLSINDVKILSSSDKALFISFNQIGGLGTIEKWVAKSVIVENIIPFWALRK